MTDNPWNDERVGELRRLIAKRLSFAQIADRLNVSRSAVIGKAKRLRINGRHQPPASEPSLARLLRSRVAVADEQRQLREPGGGRLFRRPAAVRREPIPPAIANGSLNLTLNELRFFHCRYITNEDLANATYCGHCTAFGTSWCAFHLERVSAPPVAAAPPLVPSARRVTQPQT